MNEHVGTAHKWVITDLAAFLSWVAVALGTCNIWNYES